MDYEIVTLKEKIAVGISARTSNTSPEMGMVIGQLWNRFYNEGIYASIPDKVNAKALGIYTDYASDEKGKYTVMAACETSKVPENTGDLVIHRIPAGKYAKFVVKGDMQKAVADFWQELWTMDLPRTFHSDFEEYQNNDMENAEIHIYIGLQEE